MFIFFLCLHYNILSTHAKHRHISTIDGGTELLLTAVCANGETMTRARHELDASSFKDCPHQRNDTLVWFDRGFDLDGDNAVSVDECNMARNKYTKFWERPLVPDCAKIFRHCDCDGDGFISHQDFHKAVYTCMRDCKTVKLFYKFVISRLPANGKAYDTQPTLM